MPLRCVAVTAVLVACVAISGAQEVRHGSLQYGHRKEWCNHHARNHAYVTSFGADVFILDDAGGYVARERGEIIAGRLNWLTDQGRIIPENITVGTWRGERVVIYNARIADQTVLLATADSRIAGDVRIPGHEEASPRARAVRLSQWWAALLRDHTRLADGQPAIDTIGSMVGPQFGMVHEMSGGSRSSDDIVRAIHDLPDEIRECFRHCASNVDPGFNYGKPNDPAAGGMSRGMGGMQMDEGTSD
ncbi:MAG TPA: hypothetical protein QGH10_00395 [Armatimonadota bacterium]|nr:hypothetical protein [Armatimonadota bacterium]